MDVESYQGKLAEGRKSLGGIVFQNPAFRTSTANSGFQKAKRRSGNRKACLAQMALLPHKWMMVRRFLHPLLSLCTVLTVAVAEEEKVELPAGFRLPDRSLYQKGRYILEQNCVVCHGERGNGQGEMAPQLSPKPRNFTMGLFKYRSTPWGKLPTDQDLLRTVREGRTGTAMGMFSNLREDELRAVVEYVKFFSRKWRKPENYAPVVPLPELPKWFDDSEERKRRAEAGQNSFATICATCHGPEADGNGAAAGALKDEWGNPAQPANLRQSRLRSGNDLRDVYRVLVTGLNGTPMVSFAETLTDDQRWELVAYIAELRDRFAKTEGR